MKKIKMGNSGITLVDLVITIIRLLILEGISIVTLTGSGLLEKARFYMNGYDYNIIYGIKD